MQLIKSVCINSLCRKISRKNKVFWSSETTDLYKSQAHYIPVHGTLIETIFAVQGVESFNAKGAKRSSIKRIFMDNRIRAHQRDPRNQCAIM